MGKNFRMPIVEINNLSFTYAGTSLPSIRNIDLAIDKGEFILLTGPSGCGKTTFCRCLNGLIPIFYNGTFKGSVKINNLDTTKNAINILAKHIGMVFQNPENQLFSLSVERDIAFGPENLALSR